MKALPYYAYMVSLLFLGSLSDSWAAIGRSKICVLDSKDIGRKKLILCSNHTTATYSIILLDGRNFNTIGSLELKKTNPITWKTTLANKHHPKAAQHAELLTRAIELFFDNPVGFGDSKEAHDDEKKPLLLGS